MLPDYDNLRAAFERAMADGNIDVALRLVTSSVELAHLRVGYEAAGWAERTLEVADRDNPLFPAAVGLAARGAWNRGEFDRARSLAGLAEGRVPGRGTGRVAYPADVLADLALYEGHAAAALAYYDDEVVPGAPRRRPDPAGVGPVLRRDLPRGAAHARSRSARRRRVAAGRGFDRQPDGTVDGSLRAWLGAQEV